MLADNELKKKDKCYIVLIGTLFLKIKCSYILYKYSRTVKANELPDPIRWYHCRVRFVHWDDSDAGELGLNYPCF